MVKEVKRTDTGKIYRNMIPTTILFFIVIAYVLFSIGPDLDIFILSRSEILMIAFVFLLPSAIMIYGLFGFRLYRYSTNWRVLCPVDDAEKYCDVNMEKMTERLRECIEERFERVDSVDRYDKWFQRSEGEKLFSDDFVIYVHGTVNNLEIVTIYVNLRVLNKDGDKIERMKKDIEKVLERYEPVKSVSSS